MTGSLVLPPAPTPVRSTRPVFGHVVIAHTDASLAERIARALAAISVSSETTTSAETAAATATATATATSGSAQGDLLIVDSDGHDFVSGGWLNDIRISHPNTPLLLLGDGDAATRLTWGFRAGSDGRLDRPFRVSEVVTVVRQLLRAHHQTTVAAERFDVADVELDVSAREVKRAGATVELSHNEFELLLCLLRSRGRVLSQAELLSQAWPHDYVGSADVIPTYLYYLRRKFHSDRHRLIRNVRGAGWVIGDPVQRATVRSRSARLTGRT